jgi:hypothetical protein
VVLMKGRIDVVSSALFGSDIQARQGRGQFGGRKMVGRTRSIRTQSYCSENEFEEEIDA